MFRFFYAVILFFVVVPRCNAQENLIRFHRSEPIMGTTFNLTFYATSQEHATRAGNLAIKRIKELNDVFSDYQPDSEVSKLSKSTGKRTTVSNDLWYLIKLSKKISRQSNGAFDITIGPLTKLWRRAIRQQQFPDSQKITEARILVNYRWIKLYHSKQQVKLKKREMKLDFGAIAKGYAIDQAYEVLKNQGITRALVDGGGDLFVGDAPPGSLNWDIKDHQDKTLLISAQTGVASSGDSYKNLQWNGVRYSHIVDPHSGVGLQNTNVITVIAPNATIADALSSTLSVLVGKRSHKLLKKYKAKIVQ